MVKIFNFGSINIDEIYSVPHILQSGETLSSTGFTRLAGGKGANQSVAAAHAGGLVVHAGKIGTDGIWIRDYMRDVAKVDTDLIRIDEEQSSGRALIQVSQETGDNAIILYPGTNYLISTHDISFFRSHVDFQSGNWILFQNEVNNNRELMEAAKDHGLVVVFNPAPMENDLGLKYPLACVNILIMNETETLGLYMQLLQSSNNHQDILQINQFTRDIVESMESIATLICTKYLPHLSGLIITLGEHGLVARFKDCENDAWVSFKINAVPTKVVDTTGAGDTFVGYFAATLAQLSSQSSTVSSGENLRFETAHVEQAMKRATLASSIACSRSGAMQSIPCLSEVLESPILQN